MFLTEKHISQDHNFKVSAFANALLEMNCDNRNMKNRLKPDENRYPSKLYLHEWLRKKELTAEALAEKLNTSKSVISKLANGRQQYTQEWLERMAFVFNCQPTALLRNPEIESADEIIEKLSPEAQTRALKVLKALN